MEFKDYLKILAMKDGSDLYLTVGAKPSAKFQGTLTPIDTTPLTNADIKDIAYSVMNDEQILEFENKPEMNLAISEKGVGRFRINIFKQRNSLSMVIRNIVTEIPSFESLKLPPILQKLVMAKNGLILFVGGTGSGKSTSLASLIDYRNTNSAGHIITIEDPIEYVHSHKKSIINQREVGVDTDSYADALKNTLRQAPDVILIGEIRDAETMEHALTFAETGHLAISTLHATNANQAIDRIINFFPEERRKQLLNDLSLNLQGFISQRLIPTVDGKRCAAVEVLLGTPIVRDTVKRGGISDLKEIMEKSINLGMQTFDHALLELFRQGRISEEEAIRNADSANNLRLKISLAEGVSPEEDSGLSLLEEPKEEDEEAATDGMASFSLSLEPQPTTPEQP